MQSLQRRLNPSYLSSEKKHSILSQFISWCNSQEKYRFGWLAVILTLHGCVIIPLTVLAIVLSGNSFIFWGIAIGAMAMSLITNLAAMPTKVTIPVFFFSVLLDAVIMANCIAISLNVL
ncbi:MAG: hypothetical protein ACXWWC_07395 [Chitinophagaceae bacterium]